MRKYETWEETIKRLSKRQRQPLDDSQLYPQFRSFWTSNQRIRVIRLYDGKPIEDSRYRMGRVGMTTGWRPAFILMARDDSTGSSDVLAEDDVVTAVKYGNKYLPIAFCRGAGDGRDPDCTRELGHVAECYPGENPQVAKTMKQ